MSLEGRLVLILGGTSGMGLETAHAARRAGADVAIVGRHAGKADAARRAIGERTVCGVLDARDTDLLRRALGSEAAVERLAAAIPLGRIGNPAEIAHAVMFLLTNTYTTGTTLRVDGGFALA